MEETATAVEESSQPTPAASCKHNAAFHLAPAAGGHVCKCQKLVWPRRIHALSGLLFTGFLLIHLGVSAMAVRPELYQAAVNQVESVLAFSPGLILSAIFLPFAVQAGLGLYLVQHHGLRYNVKKCNRGGKLRFFLQRWSGLAILAFFLFHVGTLHMWGLHLAYRLTHASALAGYAAGGLFQPQAAFASTVQGITHVFGGAAANGVLLAATLLAVLLTAFHAGNGAWTGGIVWKISGTRVNATLWTAFSWAIGAALVLLGTSSLYTLSCGPSARALLGR
ncbi:MAG: hypothetical protein P4M01_11320 [Acidobacteriota bacterium]|nr:hypothetical protein [Acidobacteriota bacterium]